MANYVKSTNFTAKDGLPAGNSGKIVKGSEIDTEFTAIASAIASKADTNSPTFTGTPLATTNGTATTSNTQIATTAFVQNAIRAYLPSGVIMLWSGSVASIPSGWVLCNGSNSTPDLRDKFIVGAGSTYAVNATGGSADAIVVSHTHSASSTSTVTDPGHRHSLSSAGTASGSGDNEIRSGPGSFLTSTETTGITVATSTTVSSTGSSGTNANLPPYYALAYIMKS